MRVKIKKVIFKMVCKSKGKKIRSKGKGQGKGYGNGSGPLGRMSNKPGKSNVDTLLKNVTKEQGKSVMNKIKKGLGKK